LRAHLPEGAEAGGLLREVKDGATVEDVLRDLGVPREAVKILFLNGVRAGGNDTLKDGDELGVFPAVAGG